MRNKVIGAVSALSAFGLGLLATAAHAAGFTAATTTVDDFAGTVLQQGYDFVTSLMTTGGVILFIIVVLLLAGVIRLVMWGIQRIFHH